jgi:DNA-directed RNA polymerase subunit RPC12/RpoP
MHPLLTPEPVRGASRRQFCARCGQLMFEYFRSPDGHFGLANPLPDAGAEQGTEVRCPTCGARYRLLKQLSSLGQPVERK